MRLENEDTGTERLPVNSGRMTIDGRYKWDG